MKPKSDNSPRRGASGPRFLGCQPLWVPVGCLLAFFQTGWRERSGWSSRRTLSTLAARRGWTKPEGAGLSTHVAPEEGLFLRRRAAGGRGVQFARKAR